MGARYVESPAEEPTPQIGFLSLTTEPPSDQCLGKLELEEIDGEEGASTRIYPTLQNAIWNE